MLDAVSSPNFRLRALLFILGECEDVSTKLAFCRYAARLAAAKVAYIVRATDVACSLTPPEAFLRLKRSNLWFAAALGTGELMPYLEIYLGHVYDSEALVLEPGDSIVDVGANIGLFAIRYGRAFPNVPIYSFEPNPIVFQRLVRNLKGNAIEHAVPINAAVASTNGSRDFFVGRATVPGSIYDHSNGTIKPSFSTETLTIDSFCQNHSIRSIGLLKIDVEGAEMEVLRGARVALEMTKLIMVECHSPALQESVCAFLRGYGFEGAVKSDSGWGPCILHFARRPGNWSRKYAGCAGDVRIE